MLFKFLKKKNKKKIIFIDKGFTESQFLWMLPIVKGYSLKNNIKSIVFQKKLPLKVVKNIYVKNFLNDYEIMYLEKNFLFFKKILFILITLLLFPYFLIRLNKKNIFNEKDWMRSQINHALWDTSISLSQDGELNAKLINKFKATYLIITTYFVVLKIRLTYDVHTSFLSHTVYHGRVMLAYLRKFSIVICQSAFNFYKQPTECDESWSILKNSELLKKISTSIENQEVEKYWSKRIFGKGNVFESNIINKFKNKDLDKNINVIMMHVFRDSAFNYIDKNRIFSDYIDWIEKTLEILDNSNEKWYLRNHPFSSSWGENSSLFIKNILIKKKINQNKFKFLKNDISNNLIFENANKIVTYSGTAALEFACYGKKSIIISDIMPEHFQNKICLKVKSLDEYQKLLLDKEFYKINPLDDKQILLSKKLLFIRENITSLRKDTGGFFTYRNDNLEKINKEFDLVESMLKDNSNFFEYLGSKYSSKNFTHSISSDYLNII